MKKIEIRNVSERINESTVVTANCQSIAFKNIGVADVVVNDIPISEGDALLTFNNADLDAFDVSNYKIVFNVTSSLAERQLLIIRTIKV
jgi:hypothetical protein